MKKREKKGEGLYSRWMLQDWRDRMWTSVIILIRRYDFIGLCETWIEEKGWNKIKNSFAVLSQVTLGEQIEQKKMEKQKKVC